MTITRETVEKAFPEAAYSPYQLIKVLSKLAGRNLHEQMAYNYIRKGWIAARPGPTGKYTVAKAECVRWAWKYIERNVNPTPEVQAQLQGK